MPTTVFLVRHAETFGNIEGRFCGHSETELTPKGVEQAQALGRRLRGQRFDAAYSSDLSRAHRTALYALEHHAEPIEAVLDPDLREMHYGEWESLKGGEIGARDPDLLREFFRCKVPAPGGESVEQVLDTLARGLTQKMLHGAMAELNSAEGTQRAQVADTVSRLFLRGAGQAGDGRRARKDQDSGR